MTAFHSKIKKFSEVIGNTANNFFKEILVSKVSNEMESKLGITTWRENTVEREQFLNERERVY